MAVRTSDVSLGHFKWLVESRSRNQAATTELYGIINEHEHKLNRNVDLQFAAQELAALPSRFGAPSFSATRWARSQINWPT